MMEKIYDFFYNFAMTIEQPVMKILIVVSRLMVLTGLLGAVASVGRDETAMLTGADPKITTVMMVTSFGLIIVGLFLDVVTSRWQK